MAGSRSEMARPDWIAVDWGTIRLRAWAMGAEGRPVAQVESAQGMGGLSPDQFEPALLALVGPRHDGQGDARVAHARVGVGELLVGHEALGFHCGN